MKLARRRRAVRGWDLAAGSDRTATVEVRYHEGGLTFRELDPPCLYRHECPPPKGPMFPVDGKTMAHCLAVMKTAQPFAVPQWYLDDLAAMKRELKPSDYLQQPDPSSSLYWIENGRLHCRHGAILYSDSCVGCER